MALFQSGSLPEEIRRAGFARRGRNRFSSTPGKTSAIAAPIFESGKVCGTVTLVFFASAMKLDVATHLYAEDLMATADLITAELSDSSSLAAALRRSDGLRQAKGGAWHGADTGVSRQNGLRVRAGPAAGEILGS